LQFCELKNRFKSHKRLQTPKPKNWGIYAISQKKKRRNRAKFRKLAEMAELLAITQQKKRILVERLNRFFSIIEEITEGTTDSRWQI
jgi:hypothetical protein